MDMAAGIVAALAEQGDASAQLSLATLYRQGEGVSKDINAAAKWCRMAADQGLAKAQHNLGVMYDEGDGVAQDHREAAKWFLRAAENGVVNAQFQIGVFLARGDGVEQDVVEGYKWLHIASFRKHKGAQTAREELRGHMSGAQITEAQTRSGEYIAKQQQK